MLFLPLAHNVLLELFEEFGVGGGVRAGGGAHEPPSSLLLAWPYNKPFFAPNSGILISLALRCVGHR